MSVAKREREARKRQAEPFATFRPDLLLAAAIALPGPALKALLLLHAAWRPGVPRGSAVVPVAAMRRLGCAGLRGKDAPTEALAALQAAGLIRMARPPSRPRMQGAAGALATVWALPERDGEPVPLRLPHGVRGPQGKVRLHNKRVQADVRELPPVALRMLIAIVATPDRDKTGTLADPLPMPLAAATLADLLGLSPSVVNRALAVLVATRRLTLVTPGHGRTAARYALATCYRQHERVLAPVRANQNAVPTSGPKLPDSVPVSGPKQAFGPLAGTVEGHFRTSFGPLVGSLEDTMIPGAEAGIGRAVA